MNFRDRKNYILQGRTGDIHNLLPAIEYEAKQKNYTPRLVVAKEYADILDGCSYVQKVVYDGDFRNINHAVRITQSKYPGEQIVNCAVYGTNYRIDRRTSSFTKEIWRLSKAPVPQISLPLNFDRTEPQTIHLKNDKPIIILAMKGTSSPLSNVDQVSDYLKNNLESDFNVIDISHVQYNRFYDLIALYKIAHCLIAIDSAPLHLANATPDLPVVSLISDLKDEWHQSGWRPNHILRVLYSEIEYKMGSIIEAAKQGRNFRKRKIHLVTSLAPYKKGPDNSAKFMRYEFARNNRTYVNKLNGFRIIDHSFMVANAIPKVKDIINRVFALPELPKKDDVILIANADICFSPDIVGMILHNTERYGATFTHRWDFNSLTKHLNTEAEIGKGKWYCGSDLFAFTVEWWNRHQEIFPDMYFAREFWDMIMRNMIKRSGGVETHKSIYHEKHNSFWEQNRQCAENLHNKSLAQNWFDTYGGDWNDWKKNIQLNYKFPHGADK